MGADRCVARSAREESTDIRKLVAAFAALAGLYVWVSYRMAAKLTTAERIEVEDSPADYGRAYEHVRFRSRRGDVTLDGWYLVGRVGMPVVIFVHGISSTRATGGMTELACMLNARGYGVLMFDLRGHGASGEGIMSAGWHERMDVLGAFDYLRGRGVPTDSMGVLGLSLGAAAAALAASEEPRIRAAVLDCPFARATEMIEKEAELRTPFPGWAALLFKTRSAAARGSSVRHRREFGRPRGGGCEAGLPGAGDHHARRRQDSDVARFQGARRSPRGQRTVDGGGRRALRRIRRTPGAVRRSGVRVLRVAAMCLTGTGPWPPPRPSGQRPHLTSRVA